MTPAMTSSQPVQRIIVNELLCYVNANYMKMTMNQLKTILFSFYKEDELYQAKELLVTNVESVDDKLLPRYPKRKGENRVRGTIDDITEIISIIDEQKLMDNLPKFAAVDLTRIPTVRIEDVDVYNMARKLEAIENKMDKLQTKLRDHDEILGCRRAVSLSTTAANTDGGG